MVSGALPIFISWSGERSRAAATALRDWLPKVIKDSAPWMSEKDIAPGARWSEQICQALSTARFGILCVTPENSSSPWLLFEAGALAIQLREKNVCPLLFGTDPSQLSPPLSLFQALKANKEDIQKLLKALNKLTCNPLTDDQLAFLFAGAWQDLEREITGLQQKAYVTQGAKRTEGEILSEILELVRDIDRRGRSLKAEVSDWLAFIWREALETGIEVSSVRPVYSRMPPPPDEPRLVEVTDKHGRTYRVRLDLSASPGTIMKSIRTDLKEEFESQNPRDNLSPQLP